MWKYTPELIKSQKKTIWITCIAFAIIISFALTISHFLNIETSDTKYAIVIISILAIVPIAVGLFASWALEHKAKKIWEYVSKEFSLKENEYTKYNHILKDCYKNRKMLIEVIDLLKLQVANKDYFTLPKNFSTIMLGILNADCSMITLLKNIIYSMGGSIYLFLDKDKKIFFSVKDVSEKEIYKKEIKDFSLLKEEITFEEYI